MQLARPQPEQRRQRLARLQLGRLQRVTGARLHRLHRWRRPQRVHPKHNRYTLARLARAARAATGRNGPQRVTDDTQGTTATRARPQRVQLLTAFEAVDVDGQQAATTLEAGETASSIADRVVTIRDCMVHPCSLAVWTAKKIKQRLTSIFLCCIVCLQGNGAQHNTRRQKR